MVMGGEEERANEAANHDGSDDRRWGQAKDQGEPDRLRNGNEREGGAGDQVGVKLAAGSSAAAHAETESARAGAAMQARYSELAGRWEGPSCRRLSPKF